jgi:ADP-ribosylglycohydrolase
MALCLAESLVETGGFDPKDQLDRYLRWYREGYLSPKGYCFDIGFTTRLALEAYARTGAPYPGPTDPRTAGNGSLMRLAPVALFFAAEPEKAIHYAALSSRTTHGAPQAVDACRYFTGLLVGALRGEPKEKLLAPFYSPVPDLWEESPLHPAVARVAAGSYVGKTEAEIRAGGYVVDTLEAVLWAFSRGENFGQAVTLAVNLGDDADTVGAVAGQLAGAYYGEAGIPAAWREGVYLRDRIVALADALYRQAWGEASG